MLHQGPRIVCKAYSTHRMPAKVDDRPCGVQVSPPVLQDHWQDRRPRHEGACMTTGVQSEVGQTYVTGLARTYMGQGQR